MLGTSFWYATLMDFLQESYWIFIKGRLGKDSIERIEWNASTTTRMEKLLHGFRNPSSIHFVLLCPPTYTYNFSLQRKCVPNLRYFFIQGETFLGKQTWALILLLDILCQKAASSNVDSNSQHWWASYLSQFNLKYAMAVLSKAFEAIQMAFRRFWLNWANC